MSGLAFIHTFVEWVFSNSKRTSPAIDSLTFFDHQVVCRAHYDCTLGHIHCPKEENAPYRDTDSALPAGRSIRPGHSGEKGTRWLILATLCVWFLGPIVFLSFEDPKKLKVKE